MRSGLRCTGSCHTGDLCHVRTIDRYPSDVAFTPAVKAIQDRKGSRENYARMEEGEGWSTTITPALAAFIAEQNSIYLGTASAGGQPYIQHRGGPPGFLRVGRRSRRSPSSISRVTGSTSPRAT